MWTPGQLRQEEIQLAWLHWEVVEEVRVGQVVEEIQLGHRSLEGWRTLGRSASAEARAHHRWEVVEVVPVEMFHQEDQAAQLRWAVVEEIRGQVVVEEDLVEMVARQAFQLELLR